MLTNTAGVIFLSPGERSAARSGAELWAVPGRGLLC